MFNLYITADRVGQINHGGGSVTYHESEALKSLGSCEVWDREFICQLDVQHDRLEAPWKWDLITVLGLERARDLRLAHFYAGTFSDTVRALKKRGVRVTYTAAAHDIQKSRREHELLGIPFNYPHLTNPELWKRYLDGYRNADVLIVPSRHSESVMRGFGCENRIEVIAHGVELPTSPPSSVPQRFTVGYLGAVGPDKGLIYLLQAWKKLDYKDATLVIAGRDSQSDFVRALCHHFGGGVIELKGWVDKVSDFYNSISLYVQPSITEGFGLEVLEAMAHGRPVICSDGAGACDTVPEFAKGFVIPAGNVDALATAIDTCRRSRDILGVAALTALPRHAENYTWDRIRARYQEVWKELLR